MKSLLEKSNQIALAASPAPQGLKYQEWRGGFPARQKCRVGNFRIRAIVGVGLSGATRWGLIAPALDNAIQIDCADANFLCHSTKPKSKPAAND